MTNPNQRISLEDSALDVITKLSEGNPGAVRVLTESFTYAGIDPDSAFGPFTACIGCDSLGIYGSRIWMLYKDVCKQSIVHTLACLRAVQLGLLEEVNLHNAIDGEDKLDIEAVLASVQNRLPNFGKNEAA